MQKQVSTKIKVLAGLFSLLVSFPRSESTLLALGSFHFQHQEHSIYRSSSSKDLCPLIVIFLPPFYKSPQDCIGLTQIIQDNLPISKFLIASAKSLLPHVVITFSKELGNVHVGMGMKGQSTILPTIQSKFSSNSVT